MFSLIEWKDFFFCQLCFYPESVREYFASLKIGRWKVTFPLNSKQIANFKKCVTKQHSIRTQRVYDGEIKWRKWRFFFANKILVILNASVLVLVFISINWFSVKRSIILGHIKINSIIINPTIWKTICGR